MTATRPALAAAALAALALAGLGLWRWRQAPPPPAAADDDPRRTYATSYRNVRPEVRYVGDAACAGCHRALAETYARHPMGRSVTAAGGLAALDRYDPASHNPFEQWGDRFRVVPRDGRVFHQETRDGVTLEAEVRFALGSGTRGRSYVVDRDGYLFQSPVSWFSQKAIWSGSPGFAADRHFGRPVNVACLFCHVNDAEPVGGAVNRFRTPVQVSAVGCERCHGPGELHVSRQQAGGGAAPDDTIVNPARLAPPLREAVCQQCHLQGEQRVLARGRGPFDYRPGLPLHLFWSVFMRRPDLNPGRKAVGQVEQMAASRCFRESKGKLGCVSCHDPHALPAAAERAAFYRSRCLNCHDEAACRLGPDDRRKANGDDCAACHMPRAATADIAHTAVTDHRVLARPDAAARPAPPRPLQPDEVPLVHFHEDLLPPADPGASRDLGVALTMLARKQPAAARPLGALALSPLEAAVRRDPGDVAAQEARGYALWLRGWETDARRAFEAALALAPEDEVALQDAALLAGSTDRDAEAIAYWRRAIAVNPWAAAYREQLAGLLAKGADWASAADEARAALRLDPFRVETRKLLIHALLRSGRPKDAAAEWDTLLSMKPDDPDSLRRWYAEQTR